MAEPPSSLPFGGNTQWAGMFRQLTQYHAAHGHCFVPLRCRENPKLGAWFAEQSRLYLEGKLTAEQQAALMGLGFEADEDDAPRKKRRRGKSGREEDQWEERFAELVAFKWEHKHLRITKKNQSSPGLMHWRDNQRLRLQAGTMTPVQKMRLDELGFEWEAPGRFAASKQEHNITAWDRKFAQLAALHAEHGRCHVPGGGKGPYRNLVSWVRLQRKHHRDGKLAPERRQRLESLGFAFKPPRIFNEHGWEQRYSEMVTFLEKHGHIHVTKANQITPGLMHWRDNQRLRWKAGAMPPEQKARLDALGFEWEAAKRLAPTKEEHNEATWETQFEEYASFIRERGHGVDGDENGRNVKSLRKWANRQREAFRKGTLDAERKARLDALGFEWLEPRVDFKSAWDKRYAELLAFKEAHGHLRVTYANQTSPGFAHWRDYQRQRRREGRMSEEEQARLDAIGFEWDGPGSGRPAAG